MEQYKIQENRKVNVSLSEWKAEHKFAVNLGNREDSHSTIKCDSFLNHKQNQFLRSLLSERCEDFFSHLELVELHLGEVIYESGEELQYVYFPLSSIISLLYVMGDGTSSEIAVIGFEGVFGISFFMGGKSMPNRAVVQSAGYSYRIEHKIFLQELERHRIFLQKILNYTQTLIIQVVQTAACNRHHSVDQQLCRWLLLSLDRLTSNEMIVTHELIASMLGVRRETISEAAGKLRKAGLIQYSRGHITVLDRKGLEAHACECYQVVKKETDCVIGTAKRPTWTLLSKPVFGY